MLVSRDNLPAELPTLATAIIKRFEGVLDGDPTTVNLDPYLDPREIWTIGWGHAIFQGNIPVRGKNRKSIAYSMYPGGITFVQAEALLKADTMNAAADVARWLTQRVFKSDPLFTLTSNQHAALGSWFFNLGWTEATVNSTLLKRVKARRFKDVLDEFPKWRYSGGQVFLGLVKRRACEAILFDLPDDTPQDRVVRLWDEKCKELDAAR